MHFDFLCRVAEQPNAAPQLAKMLRQARIFNLGDRTAETLPYEPREAFDTDTFFLPFPTVALCDDQSCVILEDVDEKDRTAERPHVGAKPRRRFLIGICTAHPASIASCKKAGMPWDENRNNGLFVVGAMEDLRREAIGEQKTWVAGMEQKVWVVRDLRAEESRIEPDPTHISSAIEQALFINQPKNIVIEITATKQRPEKPPRLLREHERPAYTLLRPQEARKLMGLPGPEAGSKKIPHERRAHYRRLESEFYTHKKGQTIVVASCWIGPKEAVVGNKKYRVIVDLQ